MDDIALPNNLLIEEYSAPNPAWKRKSRKLLLGLGIFLVVTITMAVKASALCSGQFEVTAYREERESGPCGPYRDGLYADKMSGGGCPVEGSGGSASADTSVLPMGTRINIDGVGERVVSDTGGAVSGYIVDFFVGDVDDAWDYGRHYNVTITWPGCGGDPQPPPPQPQPPPPGDDLPNGHIDQLDCNTIRGWAYDPDSTNTAVGIHIYIDGQGTDIGATNIDRPDVDDGGPHGFSWGVPSKWRDGRTHNVDVYAIGVDSAGNGNGANPRIGGGQIGPCGGTPQPPPPQPQPQPQPLPQPQPQPLPQPQPQPQPTARVTLAPACRGGASVVDIAWDPPPSGTTYNNYTVNIVNTSGSFQLWTKGNMPTSPRQSTALTDGYSSILGGPTFIDGRVYEVSITWNYTVGGNSNGASYASNTFQAASNCGNPPPPPPTPTVLATCTGNAPTFEVQWSAASGLSTSNFTVDVDFEDASAFQSDWWYKDVNQSGGGPYSTTGPKDFLPYPGGSALSVEPGRSYRFRVNYRVGSAINRSPSVTRAMRTDCAPPAQVFPAPTIDQKCVGSLVKADLAWSQSTPPASQYFVDIDTDADFSGGFWNRNAGTVTNAPNAPDNFVAYNGATGVLTFTAGTTYHVRVYYVGPNQHSEPRSFTARSDCATYENTLNLTTPATQVYPGETTQVFVNLRNVGTAPSPEGTTNVIFNMTAAGPATAPAPDFVSSISNAPAACGAGANGAANFTSFARNTPAYCQKATLGNYDGTRNLWQIDFAALPASSSITQAAIDLPIRTDAPAGTFCLSAYWDPSQPGSPAGRTDAGGLPGNGVCIQVLPVDRPYSAFYGNDVHAGSVLAGSANPESCNIVSPPPAGLKGQHFEDGSAAHFGTRGQYGVSATGTTVDVGSNRRPPLASSASELLIFANLVGGAAARGEIPHRVICRPDYTKITTTMPNYTTSDTATINDFISYMGGSTEAIIRWEGSGSGQKRLTGGSGVIPAGHRLTIISTQPVVIDTDITYISASTANPAYPSRNAIPAFALVSSGNIAITPSVQNLTGLYAANGVLSTCSNSAETASLNTPSLASAGNACRANRLDIYGVVHANQFYFRRLAGNAASQVPSSSDVTAAERVIATPELWLQAPPGFGAEAFSSFFKADLPPLF